MFAFLHLSDIHFTQPNATGADPHRRIRRECLREAKRVSDQHGPVSAIAVTGDIAYRAAVGEYDIAGEWFAELADTIGCPPTNVLTVPGNHDVQRSRIGPSLRLVHEAIRRESVAHKRESVLDSFLNQSDGAGLFEPLENYNQFAARYECSSSRENVFWTRDFHLDSLYKVRFVGLNSVLLSDEADDDGAHRVMLGRRQTIGNREEGIIQISMCHHPPDWLADRDVVRPRFRNRFELQMYGHLHNRDNEVLRETAILYAGALQPELDGATAPRFNLVKLDFRDCEALDVQVHDLEYREDQGRFVSIPHGDDGVHAFPITLDSGVIMSTSDVPEPVPATEDSNVVVAPEAIRATHDGELRNLIFNFNVISVDDRATVVDALKLADPSDVNVSPYMLPAVYLHRAKETKSLYKLWEMLRLLQNMSLGTNPFSEDQ